MKRIFLGVNILLLAFIGFLIFSPNDFLTSYVVLERGLDHIVVGSVLYYNITDVETGRVLERDVIENQTIYLIRPKDEIIDFELIKEIDSWILEKDADSEEGYCELREYENKKYYYDANENNKKDEGEFELYSTYVDEKGCFNVKLPDEMFIAVGL
ncbi:MAG: hypothetical protein U9Q69_01975 [Nanoarchaeota archaeon]|nr:hypothetical protein [Nanoarchaeota archaeon]